MQGGIPDGEYDLDFSGLFRAGQNDIFGLKYGFKPDTIDGDFPSQLYMAKDDWFLVSNSKVSAKAVSSNYHNDEKIYFNGKRGQSMSPTVPSTSMSNQGSSGLNITESGSVPMVNELLFSFDSVSKSFQVNPFDGFVKMNKSREPKKIQEKISKIRKDTKKVGRSQLFIDSFLNKYDHTQSMAKKTPRSPIKMIDPIKVSAKESHNKPSYNMILSKISPMRRTTSAPHNALYPSLKSPSLSAPSPTSIIPSPTRSTPTSPYINSPRLNSPLINSPKLNPAYEDRQKPTTTHIIKPKTVSPSLPTVKPSYPAATREITPNGGTGVRKAQKSVLLRKAERAMGISSGAIYKPRKKEPTAPVAIKKPVLSNTATLKKTESKAVRLLPEREMKEARPEQTSFELVLTPPIAKYTSPLEKKSGESKIQDSLIGDEEFDNFADELEQEIVKESQECEVPAAPKPSNHLEKKKVKENEALNLPSKPDEEPIDNGDDSLMEFSDWDDTDAVGEVILQNGNDDNGISGFNLIIEDDPLKSKRENEKEMEMRRKEEQEEMIAFEKEIERRQQEKAQLAQEQRENPRKEKEPNQKLRPTKTTPTRKKSVAVENAVYPNSNDNDQELEAELNKAFDDIQFDEEMSEEE